MSSLCRRVHFTGTWLSRAQSTLQAGSAAVPGSTSKGTEPSKGVRTFRPRRPNISRDRPREWKRPLAFGVLPAYDEALKYLKADSEALGVELESLRKVLEERKAAAEPNAEDIRNIEKKMEILEVQSQVNLPEVRWKVANGLADMSKATDRHIIERRWRAEGRLDELMERVHQMFVVPDVVPHLHPTLDLRIAYPGFSRRADDGRKHRLVEPGTFLRPEQTIEAPKLYKDVFHTDTRLYTLLMVDPDVPDEAKDTFQTYLHWLQPNVPLSATSPCPIPDLNTHTEYIAPHPQKGTAYHRYTTLLLQQRSHISVPVFDRNERLGFSVREFIEKYQLDLSAGGAFMWREIWDDDVSRIYRDIIGSEEPKYGRPPKHDRYAEAKARNKYSKQ